MIRKNQRRIWKFLLFISLGMSISLLIPVSTTPLPYHEVDVRMRGVRMRDGYTWFADYSQTAGPLLEFRSSPHAVWYTVWLALQLVVVAIGLSLLIGASWRPFPLADHLNIAYGYLGVSWLTLVAFRLKNWLDNTMSVSNYIWHIDSTDWIGTILKPSLLDAWSVLLAGVGIAILLTYLWLCWNRSSAPEEVFP